MTSPELNHKGEHRQSLYGNTSELPSIIVTAPHSDTQREEDLRREEAETRGWKPPRKPNKKLFALVLVGILLLLGVVVAGAIAGRAALEKEDG
jgi:hypothetical protein